MFSFLGVAPYFKQAGGTLSLRQSHQLQRPIVLPLGSLVYEFLLTSKNRISRSK
jgi:hypothetical protein